MKKTRLVAIVAAMITTVLCSANTAFAWSCQAQADDGTWGYSYNYDNRRDARRRALRECNARTDDECYIVDCQRNG